MKVIYIECDSEELRANRTILDALTDAFSGITRVIAGCDISQDAVKAALIKMGKDAQNVSPYTEDEEDESEE